MKKLMALKHKMVRIKLNQKGGLGAIGGGIIMLLVVGYVAYSNKANVSTFFATMWTYIQGKIQTIFS
jgi:hypothetical protein